MLSPERPLGWGKLVVSRETRRASFWDRLHLSWIPPVLFCCFTGCGYAPVRAAEGAHLSVHAGPVGTPELSAIQAAVAGARSELGTLGRLGSARYPALVVEVFHVEERSTGILAPATGQEQPGARGSAVTLEGRAWILDSEHASPRADTGGVRLEQAFAAGLSAEFDAARHQQALNRAARRLGRVLVRRALGLPDGAATP